MFGRSTQRSFSFWLRLAFFMLASTKSAAASLPDFQEVLTDVFPAVVHLRTTARPQNQTLLNDPQQFLLQTPPLQSASNFPLGTGFLIQKGQYCLTAYRNLAGVSELEILLRNKKVLKAHLIGADRTSDLALLKVETKSSLPSLEFADSQKALLGEAIVLIGQPLGFEPLVLQGHLMAKGGVLGRGPSDQFWIYDVGTNPANAGGPLLDRRGRVLGMAHYSPQNPAAYGFALPSNRAKELIAGLQKNGKVLRSWLGLLARNLPSTEAITAKGAQTLNQGIQIENLIIDGPAARAGLQIGDLIVEANKRPISSLVDLQHLLEETKPSTSIKLKIYRRQKSYLDLELITAEIPSAEDLPDAQDLL